MVNSLLPECQLLRRKKRMRFEAQDGENVVLHASAQERAALDEFLSRSVKTRQLDVSNAAGNREYFEELRERLKKQDGPGPLVLRGSDPLGLICLANAWAYAFRVDGPSCEYDVSPLMVQAIQVAIEDFDRG